MVRASCTTYMYVYVESGFRIPQTTCRVKPAFSFPARHVLPKQFIDCIATPWMRDGISLFLLSPSPSLSLSFMTGIYASRAGMVYGKVAQGRYREGVT